MFYGHWRDVPVEAWPWRKFSPAELACKGTGQLLVHAPSLDKLQALRDRLGAPMVLVSAYRSDAHNRAVGGATRSFHLQGMAFDVSMANHDPEAFEQAAREAGFQGIGRYPCSNFIHIDTREVPWDEGDRFPPRETRFAPERRIERESLARSRTMAGSGAAGTATVGAAGVEIAQDALAETQGLLAPLMPWLDTLRWLFIALALIGIGIAVYARWDDWRRSAR